MKNEIDDSTSKFLTILKWVLFILALGYLIKFPDLVVHKILWISHTLYEGTSFLLEEFLRHTFGFDKFLAQLIVFYLNIIITIGALFLLKGLIVKMFLGFMEYLAFKRYDYQYRLIFYWHSRRLDQKIKLILIQSTLLISAFMYMLM